jgi:hypothetical protein
MQRPSLQKLQQYASEMWDAFIEGDPDLMTSNCACCESKRALVRRMQGVTGQDVAGTSKVHKHPAVPAQAAATTTTTTTATKPAEKK